MVTGVIPSFAWKHLKESKMVANSCDMLAESVLQKEVDRITAITSWTKNHDSLYLTHNEKYAVVLEYLSERINELKGT
jgi:hypothetical protein